VAPRREARGAPGSWPWRGRTRGGPVTPGARRAPGTGGRGRMRAMGR
jgi:hypothetical protein